MNKYIVLSFILFFVSCVSPRVAYKEGFSFSEVKTVNVGNFISARDNTNSGSVVANEFVRQLLQKGYTVKTSGDSNADFIITGSVTEYFPNRKYLIVNNEQKDAENVVVLQQQMELSGSNAYNLGPAFGLGDESKIIVSNATVGVSAYLKNAVTGEVVWSDSYTYEGLDLNTALEGTVRYLLSSWKK